jgi:hypothetical protein
MKIRSDFVTNSSSSSFVVVSTKEQHDLAMEKLQKIQQCIIKYYGIVEKELGEELIITVNGATGDHSPFEYTNILDAAQEVGFDEKITDENREELRDIAYEAFYNYKTEIKKLGGLVITNDF